MANFARRRPVLAYYLLALTIAISVVVFGIVMFALQPASASLMSDLSTAIYDGPGYANVASIFAEMLRHPLLLTVFVFASAPTVAAWAVSGATGTRARWLARLRPGGPDGAHPWALYAGLLAAYALGLALFNWVAGPGVDGLDRLRWTGLGPAIGAAIGLFIDEGGCLEELGWRGFAWPLLQDKLRSPLVAALALGTMHWAWHLPREVFTLLGGVDPVSFALNQGVFLILCIALAICAGFAVNRAGGSVWPAIFVHGGSNVWSKAPGTHVAASFGLIDLRTLLLIFAAIVIVAFAGARLGRGPSTARHRGKVEYSGMKAV